MVNTMREENERMRVSSRDYFRGFMRVFREKFCRERNRGNLMMFMMFMKRSDGLCDECIRLDFRSDVGNEETHLNEPTTKSIPLSLSLSSLLSLFSCHPPSHGTRVKTSGSSREILDGRKRVILNRKTQDMRWRDDLIISQRLTLGSTISIYRGSRLLF
jgi:hypothetical protein